MGGKRIAEQVRRALITAAKTAPVVVAIDASGCGCTGGRGGTMGIVDRDAGADAPPTDVGNATADGGG